MKKEAFARTFPDQDNSAKITLDHYDEIKNRLNILHLVFWILVMVGPVWLTFLAMTILITRPTEVKSDAISILIPILALILVIPIYRMKRDYQRRLQIVRSKLIKNGHCSAQ